MHPPRAGASLGLSGKIRMQTNKGTYIGSLVEVTGEQFVARLISDDEGFTSIKDVATDKVRVGQVGSYLLVKPSSASARVSCSIFSVHSARLEITLNWNVPL